MNRLEDLQADATRKQALAIGARQDIERAEKAHADLMTKLRKQAFLASQAHWEAQIALQQAELGELVELTRSAA